jgi:tetraacyldisaccharide 4'-kinase
VRRVRLPLPVVSVGNVTWGGTGKTPLVEHLARRCLARGATPLLLTRGYGCVMCACVVCVLVVRVACMLCVALLTHVRRVLRSRRRVFDACSGGDEARMLAAALAGTPARVAVGADRHAAALAALADAAAATPARGDSSTNTPAWAAPFALAILDDGLQHLRLARDLEVVVVNALTLWGNGRRVPAGPLREAPAAALRRAHVVVAHNWPLACARARRACDAALDALCPPHALRLRSQLAPAPLLKRIIPTAAAHAHAHAAALPLEALRGARVLLLAAVGCPAAVAATLTAAGAAHVDTLSFPDHHAFTRADLDAAVAAARALRADFLVTTAKDAARFEGGSSGAALQEGLAPLGGRALILEGRLRLVAPDGRTADDAGAAALDGALDALLARGGART